MRGGKRPGAGRPKGSKSAITAVKRQFLKAFIDATQEEALTCWKSIVDPAKRFDLWLKASEFAYPKLGRLEHAVDGSGSVFILEVRKEGS